MTVIELMAELSALGENQEVVIWTDHGQTPEITSSVSEDFVLAPHGDLISVDDLKEEGLDYDDCTGVVVIFGG